MNELSVYDQHKATLGDLEIAIRDGIASGMGDAVSLEPKHHFAHGTYTRELFLPANSFVAGKIHRYDCITIILYGRARVVTDKGFYEVVGPEVLVTGSGSKGLYVMEDTLWVTTHPWDGKQTLEELEAYVVAPSYDALEAEQNLAVGRNV